MCRAWKILLSEPSVAKIGLDTAENGPRKKSKNRHPLKNPDGDIHANFWNTPNFRWLVLGCIEADFCNQIVVVQLLQHFSTSDSRRFARFWWRLQFSETLYLARPIKTESIAARSSSPEAVTLRPGLQIRISMNLNFELLNFKFELANLRTFLKLRTSPYRFPPIFKKCCILEKSRKNLANIWPKFSKNSAKFGKICKNLQKKNSKIFSNF